MINYPTQLHLVGNFMRIVLWCNEPWKSSRYVCFKKFCVSLNCVFVDMPVFICC